MKGWHGTGSMAEAHVGFCLTDDDTAAEHYAVLNDSDAPTLHEVTINTTGLTVAEVEYDYDGCEPVLGGCAADVAEYLDCDEMGRTHRTWMLLTTAAVSATTFGASVPVKW